MKFTLIDQNSWKRKEYFTHYFQQLPCTYSITATLEISALKASGCKLYPALLFLLTRIVNQHEEFRTAVDENGQVGIFDTMHPSYTVFHSQTETFSSLWTEFASDYPTFYANYQQDLALYGEIEHLIAKPYPPANIFPVSMLPWTSFTGFQLNLQKGYTYLLPIFTMGKYEETPNKVLLPISIQVHHAVCDGYHVSRFLTELQAAIDEFGRT